MGKTIGNLDKSAKTSLDNDFAAKSHTHSYAASSHTHNYAGSGSAGGAANSATKLATARTLTIGSKGKTFDGSANVSWTLSEIGAAAASHTHNVLSVKNDNFKKASDLPSTYERGETLFFSNNQSGTDAFNGLTYGLVQTLKEYSSGPAAWQFLYPYNAATDTFYVRNAQYNTDSWRSWAEVYTSLNKPTPADIGAAAASHGTHLTIGTGASNAAAGNHTHSYLPLSGGTTTGGIKRSSFPGTWVSAAKDSNAIINSTASAGGFAPFFSGKTTNGSIVLAAYQTGIQGAYLTSANVSAGTNTVTKNVTLMNESGGASWPGTVSANSFTEGGTALSSKYATTTTTGSLSSLKTSAKGSLVAAINEVFQSGSDAKTKLVNALTAKGASASTSDSWDTLIGKVDGMANLDIITASSLPSTVVNNRIVLITSTTPSAIDINPISIYSPTTDTAIGIGYETASNAYPLTIGSGTKKLTVYLKNAAQRLSNYNKSLDAYVGVSGSWKQFSEAKYVLFDGSRSPKWTLPDGTSGATVSFTLMPYSGSNITCSVNNNTNNISFYALNTSGNHQAFSARYLNQPINVSGYSKMKVTISADQYNSSIMTPGAVGLVQNPSSITLTANTGWTFFKVYKVTQGNTTATAYELDISSLTGNYYFVGATKSTSNGVPGATSAIKVFKIEFY